MTQQELYNTLSQGLNYFDFIRVCKENPLYFIHYFEVIIDTNGRTYFAVPSHDEKLKALVKEQHKVNFKKMPYRTCDAGFLLSEFGYCSIHYDHVDAGSCLTPIQKRALKAFVKAELIDSNADITYNFGYQRYEIINSFTKDDSDDFRIRTCTAFNDGIKTLKYDSLYNSIYNSSKRRQNTVYIARAKSDDLLDIPFDISLHPVLVEDADMYFEIERDEDVYLDKYAIGALYDPKVGFYTKRRSSIRFGKSKYELIISDKYKSLKPNDETVINEI